MPPEFCDMNPHPGAVFILRGAGKNARHVCVVVALSVKGTKALVRERESGENPHSVVVNSVKWGLLPAAALPRPMLARVEFSVVATTTETVRSSVYTVNCSTWNHRLPGAI